MCMDDEKKKQQRNKRASKQASSPNRKKRHDNDDDDHTGRVVGICSKLQQKVFCLNEGTDERNEYTYLGCIYYLLCFANLPPPIAAGNIYF